jgi:trimeric autotransporter adhesin
MTKRNSFSPRGGMIALGALLALAGSAYAQTDILSAAANSNLTAITIRGTGLQPPSGKPTVSLGSYTLAVASNFTNVQIVADLPANLKPGTYNLEVTANGAANFDVTIGGTSISLPFTGSVALANGAAFTVMNTAGAGMSGVGGATGGAGQAGVGALGGSGATTGGPAFLGTGGSGDTPGDGIDVTGGAASSGGIGVAGSGVFAVGGAAGPSQNGGNGVSAVGGAAGLGQLPAGNGSSSFGGDGDYAGAGATGQGGSAISGCSACVAGAGGIFEGGNGLSYGDGIDAYAGSAGSTAIYAECCSAPIQGLTAGEFSGNVNIVGNLSKSGGSFKIDHPLDPANKYLYHSFVESPDMKNIYDGNIVTDGGGHATVTLPDWFEALNSDFRYQLTVIGQFAHAIVASEVNHNMFVIRTDKPNVKVSWQVTGIRQDVWANAHRIPVEVEKDQADHGHYLHPELFDHAGEPSIVETHHPRPKKHQQQ